MKVELFRFVNRFIKILPTTMRNPLYGLCGLRVVEGAQIGPDWMIDNPKSIVVGAGSSINRFCEFHTGCSDAKVTIGDNTWVGCHVNYICVSHVMGGTKREPEM